MITAYYNEFDPKAAAWLRQLIKNGNITPGEVDERSITEVSADDLIGFDRCHFFSGIGTWDYCLNESGWGDQPIWTASLPCQPFSTAGKGLGKEDERHLLPHFLELVKECKPETIFGEQVASSEVVGSELEASFVVAVQQGDFAKANKISKRLVAQKGFTFSSRWIDDLYAEMEAEGYAVRHSVLGAHSIGAPHIRQRLYWVADTKNSGRNQGAENGSGDSERVGEKGKTGRFAEHGGMGISDSAGSQPGVETTKAARYGYSTESTSGVERLGDASIATVERNTGRFHSQEEGICGARSSDGDLCFGLTDASEVDWIYCRDNKYRPIKSGIQPLVNGATGRVVHSSDPSEPINANATQEARAIRLKGYGNAIQAQAAIAFISAYMSAV